MYSKTNKKRTIKNKTKKNKNKNKNIRPQLKILPKGFHLYASKKYEGNDILDYNKTQENKYHDKCLQQNVSWFGNLEVAKHYNKDNNHIYKWNTIKQVNLLNIEMSNHNYLKSLFLSNVPLKPLLNLEKEKIEYQHDYLQMNNNEKALYEFEFCFGFISTEKQYEFMKFVKYLIENKIVEIKRREGESILHKLLLKIKYFEYSINLTKPPIMNRLSFYEFDKHSVMNLCKIIHYKKINISGIYQKNTKSFWFPNILLYKMNILEYILFRPHKVLKFINKVM